jgi:hypothetical protein
VPSHPLPLRRIRGSLLTMDMSGISRLLEEQGGLIARRQVLACGGDDSFVEKQLRRREWARVHRGVFVSHTGELSRLQRAWAAILYYGPDAALYRESAMEVQGMRSARPDEPIHVAVTGTRRVHRIEGVRLHRVTSLARLVQPNRSPPRVRIEHGLLAVASSAPRDSDAVAVLADACQSGRTTPGRLREALAQHPKLPRRRFIRTVLSDVAQGAYSVLEHRYLRRVERPHGLPTAERQRRVTQGKTVAHRDVEYPDQRLIVELDGRLGHEEALDRWDDLDRDIDSAVEGDLTLRVGWRQVENACRTAVAVGRLLSARGWAGRVTACSAECPVRDIRGGFPAPGAGKAPRTGRQQRPA